MCPTAMSIGWSYCPKDMLLAEVEKIGKTLSTLSKNLTEVQKCGEKGDASFLWDHKSSPTWAHSSDSIPAWNQAQYRHCKPVFDSWQELRQQYKAGSLKARTGGLGNLLIVNEYESWVCVFDDMCSLGGDYFFCYVFQETSETFVPWDQHFNLKLFLPRNLD